jgi:acyl-coenzyme A synthetase/AMP-(fatty) acid ligase
MSEHSPDRNHIPFLRPGQPGDAIAWRGAEPITRRQFQRDLAALVAHLPDRPFVLNHCEDRYRFLVGLAASLTRGQVSLFPSNRAPEVLAGLRRDYPGVYCLSEQLQPDEAMVMDICTYDTRGDAGEVEMPAFPADQQVAIAFTSGSTGVPKRYPKFWGGVTHEALVAGRRLNLDPSGGGHVLATVPAQHMYGFVYSVIMPAQWGYVIGAERPFYPEDIRRALAQRPRPVMLVTTPVHIRACVLDGARLPALDFILTSTAPLDAALAAQAEALYGTRVEEFYGSTETGAIASRRQAQTEIWRTFDDIRVAATEEGFRVEAVHLPAPQILTDRVEVYSEREFGLFGRNAELVKIAGKRIALGDLNSQLLSIEGVQDGTFFMPDTDGGREPRLAAFVVAPDLKREAILEVLRTRIDPVFLPRPLRLVAELPRNETGKLPRGRLMQLFREMEEKESAG